MGCVIASRAPRKGASTGGTDFLLGIVLRRQRQPIRQLLGMVMSLPDEPNAIDASANTETPVRAKRRLKRRKRGLGGWLRSRQAGQLLTTAMVAIAAAYVVATAADAWLSSTRFGQAEMNMAQSEFRAKFGQPTSVSANGDWFYQDGGKTFSASFDADRKLAAFRCAEVPDSIELCPTTLGLRIGTLEGELLLKLGSPTHTAAAGGAMIMRYAGLGLSFRMHNQEVHEIKLSRPDDSAAFLQQVGWLLIP